jgi:hypothetical protein
MRNRTAGALALAGGLALICSACSGSPAASQKNNGSHHKSHEAHKSHKSHATTTTAPPPTSSSTTSTSTAPGPPRCTFAHLVITVGQTGAGLGHQGVTILFKNQGTSVCSLSGYPGVAALNSTGQQVSQAQRTPSGYLGGMRTGSTTPPLVVLRGGVAASALVEGTDVPVGTATSCPTYAALLVTPPTSSRSKRLTVSLPGCSPLQVHPVVGGTTGSTNPPS